MYSNLTVRDKLLSSAKSLQLIQNTIWYSIYWNLRVIFCSSNHTKCFISTYKFIDIETVCEINCKFSSGKRPLVRK